MLSESGMLGEMKVIVQQRNVGRKALIAQQYETRARRISDQREGRKRLELNCQTEEKYCQQEQGRDKTLLAKAQTNTGGLLKLVAFLEAGALHRLPRPIGARNLIVSAVSTRACGRARVSTMNIDDTAACLLACDVLFGFVRDGCLICSRGIKGLFLLSVPGTGKSCHARTSRGEPAAMIRVDLLAT